MCAKMLFLLPVVTFLPFFLRLLPRLLKIHWLVPFNSALSGSGEFAIFDCQTHGVIHGDSLHLASYVKSVFWRLFRKQLAVHLHSLTLLIILVKEAASS